MIYSESINICFNKKTKVKAIEELRFKQSFRSHSLSSLSDEFFFLAKREPDEPFSDLLIFLALEGQAGDRHHTVLIGELDCKSVILSPGVSLLIFEILILDFASRDVGHDEVSALGDPEIEVVLGGN